MFNNRLDLHGKDLNKATAAVLNKLFEFENDEYENILYIICGKGTGTLLLHVEELLEESNYKYYYDDKLSGYVISK